MKVFVGNFCVKVGKFSKVVVLIVLVRNLCWLIDIFMGNVFDLFCKGFVVERLD